MEGRVEISWGSIFRVLAGILIAAIAVLLWPMVKLLLLAILIAVALYPLVRWFEKRAWPRWLGLGVASTLLLAGSLGFFAVLGPMVFRQSEALAERLPELKEEFVSHLPASHLLNRLIAESINTGSQTQPLFKRALQLGSTTLAGVLDLFLILILAIYLMVDGPRLLKWLIVFFPLEQRDKIRAASPQVAELIVNYMVGQFITSALCAGYVFIILTLLHVPMALLLGVLAGVLDVLPIIGFFLSVIPSMAMGLTVSSTTALIIFVLYGAYHLIENYFIVPNVYGKKLQLSTLAVLLALMAGGLIAGVIGAIIVLPLVAAYPVVERIWLAPKLEPDTVARHEELKA